MTETLEDVLRVYLDIGCNDIRGFWHLTLSEISELIDSATRKLEQEKARRDADIKQQVIMLRNLSLQVGEVVACLFDKNKHDLTPLSEYYPGLFTEEETTNEMDLETYTIIAEDYCYRHNERMKKMRMQRGGDANAVRGYDTEEVASGADRQHNAIAVSDGSGTVGNEQGNRTD